MESISVSNCPIIVWSGFCCSLEYTKGHHKTQLHCYPENCLFVIWMHLFLICSFFSYLKPPVGSSYKMPHWSVPYYWLYLFVAMSFFFFPSFFVLFFLFFYFLFVIEVVLSLFTGCCEKHHTSDCFYQCNYISCVYFGNLEACLGMQQNSEQLSDVSEISSRSHMVVEAYIIHHLTITNRLNLALSFFVMMHNVFFNV